MKKVLSLVLTLTLVCSLFINIPVTYATNVLTDVINSVAVKDMNNKDYGIWNGIGQPLWGYYSNIWSTVDQVVPMPTIVEGSEAPGFNKSLAINPTEIYGRNSTEKKQTTAYSIMPNIPISSEYPVALMYVNIPKWISACSPGWNEKSAVYLKEISVADAADNHYNLDLDKVTFKALSVKGENWFDVTGDGMDGIKDGFTGWLAIDFSTAIFKNGNTPDMASGYRLAEINAEIYMVGGSAGKLSFEGFYSADSVGAVSLIVDGAEPVSMSGYDMNGMVIVSNSKISTGPSGSTSPWNYGLATANEHVTLKTVARNHKLSNTKNANAVQIHSDVELGFNSNSSEQVSFYSNISNTVTSEKPVFMFYVGLPKDYANGFSAFKVTGFVAEGWEYFPNLENVKASYLEMDGMAWVEVPRTDYGMKLPNGFKGYIKYDFSSSPDFNTFFSGGKNLWKMVYEVGKFGGEDGDVIIDGQWFANSNDSIYAEVDGGQQFKLTDGDDNRIDLEEIHDLTCTAESTGWTNIDTQVTIEKIPNPAPIGSGNATKFTCAVVEGQSSEANDGSNNYGWANFDVDLNWKASVNHNENSFIFYVECPQFVEGKWGLKISNIDLWQEGVTQGGGYLWVGAHYEDCPYEYLARDGEKWQKGTVDGNNTFLGLPSGFKGYIKLRLDTMPATEEGYVNRFDQWEKTVNFNRNKDYYIKSVRFQCGSYGGKYGDFVVGSGYRVNYDGGSAKVRMKGDSLDRFLTTFYNDSQKGLVIIRNTLELVKNGVDITHGPAIDEMLLEYSRLDIEYLALLTDEEVSKINLAKSAYNSYRPIFKGSTIKSDPAEDVKSLRIDTELDATLAFNENYTVVDYGSIILDENTFNKNDNTFFDSTIDGAMVLKENSKLTSENPRGNFSVVMEVNQYQDFSKNLYVRSFVTYTNGVNTVTVWNQEFVNHIYTPVDSNHPIELGIIVSDDVKPYLRTSLLETANALGVAVCDGTKYGDLNKDSNIDANDLVALRKYIIGSYEFVYKYATDINGDMKTDIIDLISLKKHLANGTKIEGRKPVKNFFLEKFN